MIPFSRDSKSQLRRPKVDCSFSNLCCSLTNAMGILDLCWWIWGRATHKLQLQHWQLSEFSTGWQLVPWQSLEETQGSRHSHRSWQHQPQREVFFGKQDSPLAQCGLHVGKQHPNVESAPKLTGPLVKTATEQQNYTVRTCEMQQEKGETNCARDCLRLKLSCSWHLPQRKLMMPKTFRGPDVSLLSSANSRPASESSKPSEQPNLDQACLRTSHGTVSFAELSQDCTWTFQEKYLRIQSAQQLFSHTVMEAIHRFRTTSSFDVEAVKETNWHCSTGVSFTASTGQGAATTTPQFNANRASKKVTFLVWSDSADVYHFKFKPLDSGELGNS